MIEWTYVSAYRLEAQGVVALDRPVPRETGVRLMAGGRELRRFTASPGRVEDLAAGYLLGAGIISRRSDLVRMEVTGSGREWAVEATLHSSAAEVPAPLLPLPRGAGVAAPSLQRAADVTYTWGDLYQLTRGSHAAALFDVEGRLVGLAEDIGRYNAVDKVIGEQFRRGLDLSELFLVVTCRVSGEMVEKIVRCGVSLVLTKAAPTDLAVEQAERLHLSIIHCGEDRGLFAFSASSGVRRPE